MWGHRCGVIDCGWSVAPLCVCVWRGGGVTFGGVALFGPAVLLGGNTSPWVFFACSGPFQTVGWLVGCVQSRGLGANAPDFPRFILLISFSDNLLVVLLLDIG